MDNYEDQEFSKFNEAGLQIQRLDNFWRLAESSALQGNLTRWRWVLDSIWRELYSDVMRQPDSKDLIDKNNLMRKKIQEKSNEINSIPGEKKTITKLNLYGELYELLNSRHEFLKWIQDQKAGKGGAYGSRSDTDFD